MKTKTNILITGADNSAKFALAKILKAGIEADGRLAIVVGLDKNNPREGFKSIGYGYSPQNKDVVILVGCLNERKDIARYRRIATIEREEAKINLQHIKLT